MNKEIEKLTISDLLEICKKGCDNCPKALARVCKNTEYQLVNLKKADLSDLQHIIYFEKKNTIKVKIKNLNEKQLEKICVKYGDCRECPLYTDDDRVLCKDGMYDGELLFGEEEIEVNRDELL